MVATKLSEIVTKASGVGGFWSATSSNSNSISSASASASQSTVAAGTTIPTAASSPSYVSYYYESAQASFVTAKQTVYSYMVIPYSSSRTNTTPSTNQNNNNSRGEDDGAATAAVLPSTKLKKPLLLKLMQNPYVAVRGGGRFGAQRKSTQPPKYNSMDAVRKLLYVATADADHYTNNSNSNSNTCTSVEEDPVVLSLPVSPSKPNFSSSVSSPTHDTIPETNARLYQTPRTSNTTGVVGTGTTLEQHRQHTVRWEQQQQQQQEELTRQRQQQDEKQHPTNFRSHSPLLVSSNTPNSVPFSPPLPLPPASSSSSSSSSFSPEETASQLTEGMLRALRDLALDEALDLHASLRYWSDRWERPVYSWFLAGGPWTWVWGFLFSGGWPRGGGHHTGNNGNGDRVRHGDGGRGVPLSSSSSYYYDHAKIGQKVSQIQAVLARRLSSIGELQQHLLRSGWQRGVASWGFLGEGGDWAAVAGNDGRMSTSPQLTALTTSSTSVNYNLNGDETKNRDLNSSMKDDSLKGFPSYRRESTGSVGLHLDELQHKSSPSKITSSNPRRRSLYYTNLHVVRKMDGGRINRDSTALAEWSIDAMILIRNQLYRASNGLIKLPYTDNWPTSSSTMIKQQSCNNTQEAIDKREEELNHHHQSSSSASLYFSPLGEISSSTSSSSLCVPSWACISSTATSPLLMGREEDQIHDQQQQEIEREYQQIDDNANDDECDAVVTISNLSLMIKEVSSLLDVMEGIIDNQRQRRLDRLKPPSWYKQNWYLIAMACPAVSYLFYKRVATLDTLKYSASIIFEFAKEHVVLPCNALYDEFVKGPESISDRAARDTAMHTLQKMIRTWLDETYPDMAEGKKERISNNMDISLVEEVKEKAMRSVYNMNNVIRMSFIEAQFIKKEMMNALVAMDEMQASTNFNMNLAAIGPFALLSWTTKQLSSFIFYTTFKWGKSRTETYRSFAMSLTEIERLLIMRSNPPAPPPTTASLRMNDTATTATSASGGGMYEADCVLGSDDMGMLMLHIHELRTIMYQERRRFSPTALRSVSEDLAELSGERGAVSVRQQLLIIHRMNRAYAFVQHSSIE